MMVLPNISISPFPLSAAALEKPSSCWSNAVTSESESRDCKGIDKLAVKAKANAAVAATTGSRLAESFGLFDSKLRGPASPRMDLPTKSRGSHSSSPPSWRRGRWTPEEEAYAERLIASIKKGELKLAPNMSLRKFLAEALNCDPMRISKKFPLCKYRSFAVCPEDELEVALSAAQEAAMVVEETGSSPASSPTTTESTSSTSLSQRLSWRSAVEDLAADGGDKPSVSGCHPSWLTRSGSGWQCNTHRRSAQKVRRGRWTVEEEAYAEALIKVFKAGQLPIPGSTSLRKFLSEVLRCSPMRVSKKFAGCVRKYHVYRRLAAEEKSGKPMDRKHRHEVFTELFHLERKFWKSVEAENICTANRGLKRKHSEIDSGEDEEDDGSTSVATDDEVSPLPGPEKTSVPSFHQLAPQPHTSQSPSPQAFPRLPSTKSLMPSGVTSNQKREMITLPPLASSIPMTGGFKRVQLPSIRWLLH